MNIIESAPAKINLALHVRARRDDNYHEIETLFAFCRSGDILTLFEGPLSLSVGGQFAAGLSGEEDNLILRAARTYAAAFQKPASGVFMLDKRLPVAAGIGGGSADAAATLRALARRDGVLIDDLRLNTCAKQLGSDVPACVIGQTTFGTGRGEQLRQQPPIGNKPALLVNPLVRVATADVFSAWDGIDRGAIGTGDPLSAAINGRNDLEPAARSIAPVIGTVLSSLTSTNGAKLVRMSGSGATCFALYDSFEVRSSAAASIRNAHPDWWCLETALV